MMTDGGTVDAGAGGGGSVDAAPAAEATVEVVAESAPVEVAPVAEIPDVPSVEVEGEAAEPLAAPPPSPVTPPVSAPYDPGKEPVPEPAPAPRANPVIAALSKGLEKIRFRKRAKLEKIVQLAQKKRQISNDDAQKLLRISDATASRYLAQLVHEGRLRRVGVPGHAIYEPL